jgi:hypothetical protein
LNLFDWQIRWTFAAACCETPLSLFLEIKTSLDGMIQGLNAAYEANPVR